MRYLLALLLFAAWALFAIFARHFFVCDMLQQCDPQPEVPTDVRLATLQLTEGDSIVLLDGYDHFAFDQKQYKPRLNKNNLLFLDTLAQLLQTDSTKHLRLTGRYHAGEGDAIAGFQENLGMARAAAVIDLLSARGLANERMQAAAQITTDTLLREPLRFEFFVPVEEYALDQYTFTNMTYSDANFPSDSDVFDPGEGFVFYADSVKTYLGLHPEKQIRIIGHTDSDDSDKYNQALGMRRAESTRDYFQKMGVDNAIVVESLGETKPVASNKTEEGKQANRRVNIILEDTPDN
ncbi:MAG: OmpA family protein [Bacteroidota bacterium]